MYNHLTAEILPYSEFIHSDDDNLIYATKYFVINTHSCIIIISNGVVIYFYNCLIIVAFPENTTHIYT